jgi:hypothetical protein
LKFSALGIFGSLVLLAGAGCGSDEEPTATADAGNESSAGGSSGSGGGGTGGGGTGGSDDMDAAPDVDKAAVCKAATADGSCAAQCACEHCPNEAYDCLYAGNDVSAACALDVACAQENGCTSATCPPCDDVFKANAKGLIPGAIFAACFTTACAQCLGVPEGGGDGEVPPTDAEPDTGSGDATPDTGSPAEGGSNDAASEAAGD